MKTTKITALLLVAFMLVSILPVAAFAEEATVAATDFANANLTIAVEKNSTLAPGVTLDSYTLYNSKDEQVKMFITKADMSVDTVKLFASYKDMDPTNYGMSKLTEQVAAFNEKAAAGDEYYQGTVVAGINASYYNMTTGKPTGTFVMNGIDVTTESEGNNYGYFAVMKDGSVKIGNKGEYSSDKGNIQEAIGIYTMLIVNGEICSGLDTSKYYPRQTIGITADGDVILMTADGNQAPTSVGLTVLEQAQTMLDLGCVWAGHLDGGGSCTYAAKAEGSNDFAIANSPCDGSERSISNGFIIVSTAVSDGIFASASLSAENEYVTPGSTVAISAVGVDKAGGPAEIPANAVLSATNGSIVDGAFVSDGTVGEAVVTMSVDGEAVGSTVINVVVPDAIAFKNSEMIIPFGKTVPLNLSATYGAKNVALKDGDIQFTLSDSTIGTVSGFNFTAGEEGVAATTSTLTATVVYDETVVATANINLGKGSEVVEDFEDANIDGFTFVTGYPQYGPSGANGQNELGEVYIVDSSNGKVHDGNYALALECDFTQAYETGFHLLNLKGFSYTAPANAQTIGMWIYLPELEELWTTSVRLCGTTEGGTSVTSPWLWDNCQPYSWENDGWRYFTMDISSYTEAITFTWWQFYICDRDNNTIDPPFYFKDHASVNSKFTYYIDNITIDYSSAVDDREPPVWGDITYATENMADAAVLDGNTVDLNKINFSASVADDTTKDNFTGLDVASVKAYVDGVEVPCTYANGIVSIEGTLADGVHTVKFVAADEMGNSSYKKAQITVAAGSDLSTVSIVPADPTATDLLIGSLYWINIVASDIEKVVTAEVELNLNSMSQWELDHMDIACGFDATFVIDEVTNNATIKFVANGKCDATGEAVIASLPIRTWESRLTEYPGYENQTPETLWSRKIIWPIDIKLSSYKGYVEFSDNTTGSFSMAPIAVITELYGNYGEMNANGNYSDRTSWHIHTEEAVADKAATCTEDGYTGRTFCSVCNSVVDWGTTIPATGHTYEVVDGVVKCACGELFNGVYTDGKLYIDGVVVADGWTDADEYYVNGVKVTGLQKIGDYYYDFGTDGVCANQARLDGYYYNEAEGAYMYFAGGVITTGDLALNFEVHFFDENGVAFNGDVDILGYTCTFDEKGVFVSAEDSTILEAGSVGTNLKYILFSDGKLIIDGEGAMRDYTVSGIYAPWFYNNMANTNYVTIGDGVTSIGEYAFNQCHHVKTVDFEEGSALETISDFAFRACHRLNTVNLPANLKTIGNNAFFKCGALATVNFEEGSTLKTIGRQAFAETHVLKSLYIPASVVELGESLFARSQTSVVLKVVEDSSAYFYAIENSISYELVDGVVPPLASGDCTGSITWALYPNGDIVISGAGAMADYTSYTAQPWASVRHLIKNVIIGKDITTIGNYAFAYCEAIETIEFEEGSVLESVGVLSFRSAKLLEEVVLPETVASLNTYAFGTCTALTYVYIPQGMSYMHSKAFAESTNVVLNVAEDSYAETYATTNNIAYETRGFVNSVIANGSVSDTATWTLYENGDMIIEGTGAIPNYASQGSQPWASVRHLIKKVTIGKDITAIGNYAFAYCVNNEAIVFEEGSIVETIGVLAFRSNNKVTEVILPETVTYLNAYAFGTCPALVSVYIPQGLTNMHGKAFVESANVVLNVAEGSAAEDYAVKYSISYETREFIDSVIASGNISDTATWTFYESGELAITGTGAIPNYASQGSQPWASVRHLIKKVTIGKDITAIGNYAFAYCVNNEAIVFEEGSIVETIGVLAFRSNNKVTEVTLPETVTYLNAYAFGTCPALVSVYIPQGLTKMHGKAFVESANVVLNVAEGSAAEDYAVKYSISYETREFIDSIIASGNISDTATWTFYESGELAITGTGEIPNYASQGSQPWASVRHLIKKVTIGKDITAIGNYAFAYCVNNEAIVFEEGSIVETIGVLAFRSNNKVTEVILPETVKTIATYAFGTCTALTNVYVPQAVTSIHSKSFAESANVILNVAEGSYAESYAVEYSINYVIA